MQGNVIPSGRVSSVIIKVVLCAMFTEEVVKSIVDGLWWLLSDLSVRTTSRQLLIVLYLNWYHLIVCWLLSCTVCPQLNLNIIH